ncbi:MAG: aspartate ammonia-lyase [Elusimicrobiota bacterium]
MSGRTRIEKDSLGTRKVPREAYYGVQTLRAKENFPVSGLRAHPALIRAYAAVKVACATANRELGALKASISRPVIKACEEVLAGRLDGQFVVDVYQAGAGTSLNMNVNEVVANRALELSGRPKGDYSAIHPNDHVNMSQSTNDSFPTATYVALLGQVRELLPVLRSLEKAFAAKGREFRAVVKSARTHLQDAVPISLGQEFAAYAAALRACRLELERRSRLLREVPLGGTAAGTGANTPPGFRRRAVRHLARLTGLPLKPAPDMRLGLQSHQPLAAVSSALKELCLELIRVANDLRLLSSGPNTGLAEIRLPAAQPGSSIMPGKVNPSILECLNMVAFQIVARDLAVALCAQAGQMDLNVMMPLSAHNLLDSAQLLINFLPEVERRCVREIRADAARCRDYRERSLSVAALLNPLIGYARAGELFREAQRRGVAVTRLVEERGLLTRKELDRLLDPHVWERRAGARRTKRRR